MSYASQALLSRDHDFLSRLAACAARELPRPLSPTDWANEHVWKIAASPGFADAYQYALDTDVERPGWDGAVITDAQLLAAVQAYLSPEPLPEPPPE